jgi:hypothetical protein
LDPDSCDFRVNNLMTLLGGNGNIRRWSLVGETGHWGVP